MAQRKDNKGKKAAGGVGLLGVFGELCWALAEMSLGLLIGGFVLGVAIIVGLAGL